MIPRNVERRLFHSAYLGPYRAWDAAGRLWNISGKSGAWRARCLFDAAILPVFGRTLAHISTKLEKIA